MDNIFNKIFPPKCLFCSIVGSFFCENCLSGCRLVKYQKCIVCNQPSIDGKTHQNCLEPGIPSQLICIYEYYGKVRECIKKSKYYSRQFLALKILSKEALGLSYEWMESFEGFTCVPIPLSKEKYLSRGFNQALLIALTLSKGLKLELDDSLLTRIKGTKAQHAINRRERFKNVFGCFEALETNLKGKKILLVDDICTTGATLLEASKTLYKAGAEEVKCFTLSKKL
jgi:ComF family protein